VSVTDANNCVLTSTANIGLTNTLAVTNPIINQNPTCFGANNGSAFVSAAGANNIRFLWINGETNSNATALNAGLNQVTVSAAGGCVVVRNVQLNSPTQIRTLISNTHTVCTPNSGILIANNTNGGSGSGYQFVWSNGRSGSVQTGLSSGTYTLTITDGTGCSAISSTQISISTPPTLSATHTNPTCLAGGNITLSISPAANYTFLWSNGATTQNLSGIQGGIYTVEARNGTCVVSLRDTIPAVLPLVIGFSTTQPTNPNSNNGSVSAAVSNGLAPFSYVWNNTSTSNVLLGIGVGNYQVTVTDANGCTATNSVNLSPLTNVSQTTQLLDEFSVYPNPSAGVFGVKIGFLETQNFELQVVDMLGQVLFRQQYTSQQFQTQIDLSAYSTGIYLLRLQTDTIQKTIKIISKTN
jgi:Secretion system C-terminal sorting domain